MSLLFLILHFSGRLVSNYDAIALMLFIQLDYIGLMETLRWRRLRGK